MTWVAAMTAMRCPFRVIRYGVKAWAALLPIPMMGYFACAATVRFWESPCCPQSSPWSFASVARLTLAALRAVRAEAGASKM